MEEEKKGWLSKAFGQIIEITPDEKPTQPKNPAVAPVATVNSMANVSFTPNTVATAGVVDPKFVEHFSTLLESQNIPGPDYMEFSNALEEMRELGLPEDKMFQATWKSFGALGVKDSTLLVTTAQKYVDILNKDKENFLSSVKDKINSEVGTLQTRATELEARNKMIAQQIADLQMEVNKNNDESAAISGKIAEQTVKITTNKNNYEVTHVEVVKKIQNDVIKINQYITNK